MTWSQDINSRLELDSHADTMAFGKNSLLVSSDTKAEVSGFNDGLSTVTAEMGTVAIAYDCPNKHHTYILFFPQSLYFGDKMETTLGNPFQMRNHGVVVNDIPLQHIPPESRKPGDHCIIVDDHGLCIPLSLRGTMSGFTFSKPTADEINDTDEMNVTHVQILAQPLGSPSVQTSLQQKTQLVPMALDPMRPQKMMNGKSLNFK